MTDYEKQARDMIYAATDVICDRNSTFQERVEARTLLTRLITRALELEDQETQETDQ